VAGATEVAQVSNSRHLRWQHPLTATIEAKGLSGTLATREVSADLRSPGTGPPEIETAAPAGNKGGGKKEIRDEPHTYTRHSATARWHQLGDVTADDADPHRKPSQAIRGELIGSDQCCALGYTARGYTPVLRLCQMLLNAGYDPTTSLHAYRGETLCLLVRSIGEAATLEPNRGALASPDAA
jgi:hypothetical protein